MDLSILDIGGKVVGPVAVMVITGLVGWAYRIDKQVQATQQKVDAIEQLIEDQADHDKRIAVIESVVVALKDIPVLTARIGSVLDATTKRLDMFEDYILSRKP